MSFVILAKKTLHSITNRKMLGLMLLCAALGVLVVLALVLGITWLTADLVALKRSWLDTAINWAQKSYEDYNNKLALEYVRILENRIYNSELVKIQEEK